MLALLAQSPTTFVLVVAVLGLLIGSFLNVVIYRLPVMLERQWRAECTQLSATTSSAGTTEGPAASVEPSFNLVVPRSTCPRCHSLINAWQNIPVVSYVVLRGRCAHCKAPISARYPAVEALSGLMSAIVAWHFGFGWSAGCALVVTWFLIALTFIDVDHQLLPDSLTLPLLWLGLLASLSGWGSSVALPVDPVSAIAGAAIGYGSLWIVYHGFRLLTGKEGMGYGDFKLLAALGAWLGYQLLLPVILLSAVVGALIGIALIAMRRHHRGNPMPFGPYLAAAGWITMLWGHDLVTRYLGLYSAHG